MRTRTRAAVLGSTSLAAIGLVACTVANGLIIPPTPATVDAGDGGDGCEHAFLPARPIEPDGFVDPPLVFAMDHVAFGSKDGGSSVGFDLDNSCTCAPHAGTCTPRSGAPEHCDAPGGRDNTIAAVTGTFTGPFNIEDYMNRRLKEGSAGMLIVISGYNGLADDANVSISFLPSAGRLTLLPDGGTEAITDGGLRWSYDPNFDQKLNLANAIQILGYVKDHVAVAISNGAATLPLAGLDLGFSKGFIVAPIKMNPPRIEDGVLGGRWPIDSIAASVGRFSLDNFGVPGKICETDFFTEKLIPQICATADISANEGDDNKGKPCDALSVAISFSASPAEKGDPVPLAPVESCGADGRDAGDGGQPVALHVVCP